MTRIFFLLVLCVQSFASFCQQCVLTNGQIVKITRDNAQKILYSELSTPSLLLRLKILKRCIDSGALPCTVGETGWSCLHECAMQNDTAFADTLLDIYNVAPDSATEKNNATPYIIAASRHHYSMCSKLIKKMDPQKFALRTKFSKNRAIDFLGPKEKLRMINEEQNRIEIWKLRSSKRLTCDKIQEIVRKDFSIPTSDTISKFILGDDVQKFDQVYAKLQRGTYGRRVFYKIPVDSFSDGKIELDEYTLAAILGSVKILRYLIRGYYTTGSVNSIPKPLVLDCYVAKDSLVAKMIDLYVSTYNDSIKIRDSLRNLKADPKIVWNQPNQDTITSSSSVISINVCFKGLIETDSVFLVINDSVPVCINNEVVYSAKKLSVKTDPSLCDMQICQKICLHNSENVVRIEIKTGSNRIMSTRVIEYMNQSDASLASVHKRKALVIGNSNYTNFESLNCAYNDADTVAHLLDEMCFDVLEVKDLCGKNINGVINTFNDGIGDSDIIFVFYSGHGAFTRNETYIIPSDARKSRRRYYDDDYISMESLIDSIKKTYVSIYVFDGCRNFDQGNKENNSSTLLDSIKCSMTFKRSSFVSKKIIDGEFIQKSLVAGAGRAEIYSAQKRRYAWESERFSLYTGNLVKHLSDRGLSVTKIFKRIADEFNLIENVQYPDDKTDDLQEFILNPFKN